MNREELKREYIEKLRSMSNGSMIPGTCKECGAKNKSVQNKDDGRIGNGNKLFK